MSYKLEEGESLIVDTERQSKASQWAERAMQHIITLAKAIHSMAKAACRIKED